MINPARLLGSVKRSSHQRKNGAASNLALGLLGAAVATSAVLQARRRRSAFRGKVVLVTGGSRGLGLEIARQFGLAGAHIAIAARDPEEMQRALAFLHTQGAISNGTTAHTVTGDISKPEDAARIVAETVTRYGRLDVLVNVPAVMTVGPFEDQPLSVFHEAMNINFYGALHMIQAALPHLRQQPASNIVTIASLGGKIGVPHMLPYVASKFALVGLCEGLHAELRHHGVRVTTVNPGILRTGSHVQARFVGNAEAEYRWFFSGMSPGISKSARGAARDIFNAAADGKAEIDITPQAWLAARLVGIAPGLSSIVASWLNDYLLPAPNGDQTVRLGRDLKQPTLAPARAWSERLQSLGNQRPD